MRSSVLGAFRVQQEQIDAAENLIAEARAEQARLRRTYPVFFPDQQQASGGHSKGTPTPASQNQLLRVVAEHPGITRKRTARLVNFSESWVSAVVKELNLREDPPIQFGRSGRMLTYTLTAAGEHLINNGGIQDGRDEETA